MHEKAIMLVLIPLRWVPDPSQLRVRDAHFLSLDSLMAAQDRNHYRAFVVTSVAGIYSLFPLLFHPAGKLRQFAAVKDTILWDIRDF